MGLNIYWTDFSKDQLREIFTYYKKEAGVRVANKLVTEIINEVFKLQQHPDIGQKEEILISRIQAFRYLVHNNYKIIYWVNSEKFRIEIIDVFDTRQNPIKIKRTKK